MEEACADIESIRRQLAALRSQDAMLSGPPTPSATPTRKVFDGGAAQEKTSKENCQLEAGLEEAKVLSSFTFMMFSSPFMVQHRFIFIREFVVVVLVSRQPS